MKLGPQTTPFASVTCAPQVFKLPEPCTKSFLLQLSNWQHTRESEDLNKEREEYYGTAGGDVFGARVSLAMVLGLPH